MRLQLAHRAVTNPSLEKELATDAQGKVGDVAVTVCVWGGGSGGCLFMNSMGVQGKVCDVGSDLERGRGGLCHTDAQGQVGDVAVAVG